MRQWYLAIGCAVMALQAEACDVALLLAVDVSGSVDAREYRLQMEGLGTALADGAVSEALVRAEASVMLMQWTGQSRQKVTIPWTKITDFDIADNIAARVAKDQRIWRNFATAIGDALSVAVEAFDEVEDCARKIIDVSGDGSSNEGPVPREIHPMLRAKGITVNGLAIETSEPGLTEYFRRELITGPGAFAMRADNFEAYPDRIRQKLLREITKQLAFAPDNGKRN